MLRQDTTIISHVAQLTWRPFRPSSLTIPEKVWEISMERPAKTDPLLASNMRLVHIRTRRHAACLTTS